MFLLPLMLMPSVWVPTDNPVWPGQSSLREGISVAVYFQVQFKVLAVTFKILHSLGLGCLWNCFSQIVSTYPTQSGRRGMPCVHQLRNVGRYCTKGESFLPWGLPFGTFEIRLAPLCQPFARPENLVLYMAWSSKNIIKSSGSLHLIWFYWKPPRVTYMT